MCGNSTTKREHVILDFDIVSEIITFEQKEKYSKEKQEITEQQFSKLIKDCKM